MPLSEFVMQEDEAKTRNYGYSDEEAINFESSWLGWKPWKRNSEP